MWKSAVGHNVSMKVAAEGDDWETDPDFENDVSEQEQRWGAKTIEGSGRKEHISVAELRNKVAVEHEQVKQKDQTPKASYGYGGKFGVEKDRMDKVALGNDYVAQVEKHSSQKDAAQGFGGKFGVQKDRVDKSAMGFEYKGEVQQHASQRDYSKGFGGKYGVEKEKVDKAALGYDYKGETEKHQSQKDYAKGFGGKYGVEKEKVDKAALGYDYKGETEKHQSQKDYSKGFGGKFGVEKEKVDKAALGYDYKSETEKHQSQKDYKAGFGGRYGVQADRMDKSAAGFSDMDSPTSAYERTQPLEASSAGAGKLKARFENMAKASDEENRKKAEEEKARRQARESREREAAKRRQEEQSSREEEICPDVDGEYDMPPQEIYEHMPDIEEIPEPESAAGFSDMDSGYERTQPLEASSAGAGKLKARFENLAKASDEDDRKKAEEEKARRQARESREREAAKRRQEEQSSREEEIRPPPVPDVDGEYDMPPQEIYEHMPDIEEIPEPEEEPEYENPPALPPRSDDFLDLDAPPLPARSEDVDDEEDEGEYEELVEPPHPEPTAVDNDYEDLTCGKKAIAIYDYEGEADDEISFNPDDIITNIEMIDEGWWKGQCRGRTGLFPSAYVELLQ